MEEKELNELWNITKDVKIGKKTYFFLAEDELDGNTGTWGWNNDLSKVIEYFLYIFVLGRMHRYNQENKVNKVSTEFIESTIYDMIMDYWDVTETDDAFFDLWKEISVSDTFTKFQRKATELCEFLTSIGYPLNYKVYKNMKEAYKEAPYLVKGLEKEDAKLMEWLQKE